MLPAVAHRVVRVIAPVDKTATVMNLLKFRRTHWLAAAYARVVRIAEPLAVVGPLTIDDGT